MVDFEAILARRYAEASPEERARMDEAKRRQAEDDARPRVRVRAMRQDCVTGQDRIVMITLVVRPGSDGEPWLFVDEGAVTGYESMPANRLAEAIEGGKGWAANWGTRGRWDKLTVPVESLKEAKERLVSK